MRRGGCVLTSLLLLIAIDVAGGSATKCFYLTDIAIIGGTYDEIDANDIRTCCMKCAANNCCLAYTYDKLKQRCYLKSSIAYSEVRSSMTSGLKANILQGAGCRLPNVQIDGGTLNVPLKNHEECQQYCNSYGIFSWLPPRVGEENGNCMCTKRITSLRYYFGAHSAILPIHAGNEEV